MWYQSKRLWLGFSVIMITIVSSSDEIAKLGLSANWQMRIVAFAGIMTKVMDEWNKAA